jgi:hypothetical protein
MSHIKFFNLTKNLFLHSCFFVCTNFLDTGTDFTRNALKQYKNNNSQESRYGRFGVNIYHKILSFTVVPI